MISRRTFIAGATHSRADRVAREPDVYFKFASADLEMPADAKLPTADFLRHAVDIFGTERMMWESDPGNTPDNYQLLLDWISEATARLSLAKKRQLLCETGKRLHVRGGRADPRCA